VEPDLAPVRFAVAVGLSRKEIEAYLPANYELVSDHDADPEGRKKNCVIQGRDSAGWTLDGYVIPRFASGNIGCREFQSRHDAEVAACAAMN
jgi:hypothetical protein